MGREAEKAQNEEDPVMADRDESESHFTPRAFEGLNLFEDKTARRRISSREVFSPGQLRRSADGFLVQCRDDGLAVLTEHECSVLILHGHAVSPAETDG